MSLGGIEQAQQAQHGVEHRHAEPVHVEPARGVGLGHGRQVLVADQGRDLVDIQVETQCRDTARPRSRQ